MKLRWLAILCALAIVPSCDSKSKHKTHRDDDDDEPRRASPPSPESVCKKAVALREKEHDDKKSDDDKRKQLDDCVKDAEHEKSDNPKMFECMAPCADKDTWKDFKECTRVCKRANDVSTTPPSSAQPSSELSTDGYVKAYCDCASEVKCLSDAVLKYADVLAKTPLTNEQSKKIADCSMPITTDGYVKAYCDCKNDAKCLADAGMKYGKVLSKTPLDKEQSKKIADCTIAASK